MINIRFYSRIILIGIFLTFTVLGFQNCAKSSDLGIYTSLSNPGVLVTNNPAINFQGQNFPIWDGGTITYVSDGSVLASTPNLSQAAFDQLCVYLHGANYVSVANSLSDFSNQSIYASYFNIVGQTCADVGATAGPITSYCMNSDDLWNGKLISSISCAIPE